MKRNLHFKVFLTIYMHQFGWLSERGGNFLNLLQKEGGSLRKGGFQPWRKLWEVWLWNYSAKNVPTEQAEN